MRGVDEEKGLYFKKSLAGKPLFVSKMSFINPLSLSGGIVFICYRRDAENILGHIGLRLPPLIEGIGN